MHSPKVSVIIPAYNVREYIGTSIQSVLGQTFTDLEVIVVDDGSQDGTSEAVLYYGDPRIRLTAHHQREGPSASRNTGLDMANGEWIAILDADDWWDPSRLERLLGYAEARTLDIVGDDLWICETKGGSTATTWKSKHFGDRFSHFGKDLDAADIAALDIHAIQPIARKETLTRSNLRWRKGMHYSEDFYFLMDAVRRHARIAVYPEALYYYRKNREHSLTSNLLKTFKGNLEAARYYAAKLDLDTGTRNLLVKRMRYFQVLFYVSWVAYRVFPGPTVSGTVLNLYRRIVRGA